MARSNESSTYGWNKKGKSVERFRKYVFKRSSYLAFMLHANNDRCTGTGKRDLRWYWSLFVMRRYVRASRTLSYGIAAEPGGKKVEESTSHATVSSVYSVRAIVLAASWSSIEKKKKFFFKKNPRNGRANKYPFKSRPIAYCTKLLHTVGARPRYVYNNNEQTMNFTDESSGRRLGGVL